MTPRFAAGDRVRVRAAFPPTPPAHIRAPFYIRGKAGTVERVCGEFGDPEELAFGRRTAPKQVLYRVRFRQADVWAGYDGAAADRLDVELYESWLEPERGEGAA